MAEAERAISEQALKTGLIAYGLDRQLGGIGRYTEELIRVLNNLGASPAILDAGGCSGITSAIVLPGAKLLPALLTLGDRKSVV